MAQHLTSDPALAATSFLVIDFETTTPAGRRPEPIEVAALALRANGVHMAEVFRHEALIHPPEHAPISGFDARQTGITRQMVARQPPAGAVLAALDARLTTPPYRLVAHHAPTEGGIVYDYRHCCPRLAATPLLDTVRLARGVYPELPSHRLDALLDYLDIPRPAGRHRAMTDVEATADVFTRLLVAGSAAGSWRTLRDLTAAAGLEAKAAKPTQDAMF